MPHLLTTYLLVQNNEATIEDTLESILPLKSHILVGDLGCTDNTIAVCERYGATVMRISLNDSRSQARNLMLQNDGRWHFWIEPWETLLSGTEHISNAVMGAPDAYKLSIMQGDVVTKQIRLWHKNTGLKFENPVYETVVGKGKELSVYIAVGPHQQDNLALLEKWKARCPFATEPIYYTACSHLANKNWRAFLNYADLYLHQEKQQPMSLFMTHYYCAMVYCYIEKQGENAIKSLLPCLARKPDMAEFWCLLGDVYYAGRQYDKAKTFYENALIAGSRRLKDDGWPVEISKYKEYPQKMMGGCDQIKQTSRLYVQQPSPATDP